MLMRVCLAPHHAAGIFQTLCHPHSSMEDKGRLVPSSQDEGTGPERTTLPAGVGAGIDPHAEDVSNVIPDSWTCSCCSHVCCLVRLTHPRGDSTLQARPKGGRRELRTRLPGRRAGRRSKVCCGHSLPALPSYANIENDTHFYQGPSFVGNYRIGKNRGSSIHVVLLKHLPSWERVMLSFKVGVTAVSPLHI